MKDVMDAAQRGGRLICHHLEFDCGIIDRELRRAGLGDLCSIWEHIAKGGFCTMALEVGEWTSCAADTGKTNHLQTLSTLAKSLLPTDHEALKGQAHRAGSDTLMLYWSYITMLDIAESYRSKKATEA